MRNEHVSRDASALVDIINAAKRIAEIGNKYDWAAFKDDFIVQSAVIHQFVVFGEAVKRLSQDVRDVHTKIPWKRMAGMRDYLVHKYDAIDLEIVWNAATIQIPKLIEDLEQILKKLSDSSPMEEA